MKRKKTVALAILFGGIAVALSSVTLSFLGGNASLINNFLIGHNKSSIDEEFEGGTQTTGSKVFGKIVKVKNEDNVPCYVRVYMDFSNSDAENKSKLSNDDKTNTESQFYEAAKAISDSDGKDTYIEQLASATGTVAPAWIYVPDTDLGGYYYYLLPLEPNTETGSLIQQVKVENGADEGSIKDFNIFVYSETVGTKDSASDVNWESLTPEEKEAWKTKALNAWTEFLQLGP